MKENNQTVSDNSQFLICAAALELGLLRLKASMLLSSLRSKNVASGFWWMRFRIF